MSFNDAVFVAVPLLSALFSIFLFLTFLSAKKNRLVYSFMLLQVAFILWTSGSVFMRLSFSPGVPFWFQVSAVGIFAVPYLTYLFLSYFTNQKGSFLKVIWGIGTFAIIVLQLLGVFMQFPVVLNEQGERAFVYHIMWTAVFPVVLAVFIIISTVLVVVRSVRRDGVPFNIFLPLLCGVGIMFAGILIGTLPGLTSLPIDPFACMLNSLCIYYMLYKKRIFSLTELASRSSTYFVSAIVTTLVLFSVYPYVNRFFDAYFSSFGEYETLVTAVLFSVLAALFYTFLRKVLSTIFVRDQLVRDNQLRDFSLSISKTLDKQEILSAYSDLLHENLHTDAFYICLYDKNDKLYRMMSSSDPLKSKALIIVKESPLVKWLEANNGAVTYREFQWTPSYKSTWETEKRMLSDIQTELILPIICDGELIGITFFAARQKRKSFTHAEISFLESAVSIASIAIKNAGLYETIINEARRDAMTNLYNRRYFLERFETDFNACRGNSISLLMFNLDDFALYNELYGSHEGDLLLKAFGEIITLTLINRGVAARYGGKEFIVYLPYAGGDAAMEIAEQVKRRLDKHLAATTSGLQRFITFSAGICSYPTAAASANELITNASFAVYAAKNSGKNKTIVYTRDSSGGKLDGGRPGGETSRFSKEYASTIYALTAAIDAKDHYTFRHSNNVSEYATILAESIGLDKEHVEIIREAGLLHDIGKIGIPEHILSKTSGLTEEENNIMRQHVERSIAMIRYLPSLDYVIPNAITHHERWDGKGYPRGIAGENIPIGGRCLSIADAFDAMLSKRSYKKAMEVSEALAEIERNLGTQFDPVLGRRFIELVKAGAIRVKDYG